MLRLFFHESPLCKHGPWDSSRWYLSSSASCAGSWRLSTTIPNSQDVGFTPPEKCDPTASRMQLEVLPPWEARVSNPTLWASGFLMGWKRRSIWPSQHIWDCSPSQDCCEDEISKHLEKSLAQISCSRKVILSLTGEKLLKIIPKALFFFFF